MGSDSDAARLPCSVSPEPDPARTLPRLAALGASSSTRPLSSASINVLLNPVLDDSRLAAGQQWKKPHLSPPTPSAWTAVNHPPRASSVLEPRAARHHSQAHAQHQTQHQRQPSADSLTRSSQPSSVDQEYGQTSSPAKDPAPSGPSHDDQPSSTTLGSREPPPITVVWGAVARSRPRSSKQRRRPHQTPLSVIYPKPHPTTPPSPAPSPELESPNNPSVVPPPAPQPPFTAGRPVSEAPVPVTFSHSQHPQEFARPERIVRFSDQSNAMPMSPPPNPVAVVPQSTMVIGAVSQHGSGSPSSPDVCTQCYSFYRDQFHAAMQNHEQQSQQMSLSKNSQEDYNRFLEAGRASILGVRLQFDSVRQMCPECAGKPPEDSVENVKVAFRDVMPIRDHPTTGGQGEKRKLDLKHGLIEDESSSKSRRVSPELVTPALCESTPPPEPESRDGTRKYLLGDINDMFVGFYRERPLDDVVPSGPLERTARSLGLATESGNVSARNDPAPDDWRNMYYDPIIDSEKMSESARLAPSAIREKSR